MTVRVKFCGLTTQQDAQLAVELGADALGLNFCPETSARYVSVAQAKNMVRHLPPYVTLVGVFQDPDAQWVQQVLQHIPLHSLQFHGNESVEFCRSFSRSYDKAVTVTDSADLVVQRKTYSDAQGLLVDSPKHVLNTAHWEYCQQVSIPGLVLAGGLTPDNVGHLIKTIAPAAVDVASGIESAVGVKDVTKMTHFIEQVRKACL